MSKILNQKVLSLLVLVLIVSPSTFSQKTPSIKQRTSESTCSNIVALAGNVSIRCSSLTPAQLKLIEGIPAVLHQILETLSNEPDPSAIVEKLDNLQRSMNAVLEEVNPNAPKVTYSKGGIKRTTSPGRFEVSDGATSVYQQLATLGKSQQWAELAKECEAQILRRPGWYTPYVFAGIAYANLGNASRAIELLEKADRGMANNPDYEDLPKLAKDLLTKLKPQE